MSTDRPDGSARQRLLALDRANDVPLARAALKRRLRGESSSAGCGTIKAMRSNDPRDGYRTWNDRRRIAAHRAMSPKQRLRLTIEASRAALRFAQGRRTG
jgi:hypothetical protein